MSAYVSNATPAQIAARIMAAQRIAITTHTKPDGDAAGSTIALARALHARSQQAEVFWAGPVEASLPLIARPTPFVILDRSAPGADHDLVVILDTGSWSQLEELSAWLRPRRERIIVLDHHAHGDDDLASMRWVDGSAASSTMIVAELLDEMGASMTGGEGGVAEALFVGLATDTGWFRHSSADARAFALAARLIAAGVGPSRLLQIIEQSHRPARLALMARALASVEYVAGGAAAVMTITPADFNASGGALEDLTCLVNEPLMVGAVRVSALVSQSEPGKCKISARSKPAVNSLDAKGPAVDVNKLCRQWGGGGHIHAAGARVRGELPATKAAVIAALEAALGARSPQAV